MQFLQKVMLRFLGHMGVALGIAVFFSVMVILPIYAFVEAMNAGSYWIAGGVVFAWLFAISAASDL